jgi:sugar phosphate isomerase/epimerase
MDERRQSPCRSRAKPARDETTIRRGGMRRLSGRLDLCAINTATLGFRAAIGHTVDAVARRGFGGICPWRREMADEPVAAVGRRIRDAGLTVTGYCRSSALTAADAAGRAAALADNRRAVDEAATLGAPTLVMVVGGLPAGARDLPAARGRVAEGTAALMDHARQAGVRLALEPLHPMYAADRSCLSTLEEALDLCDALEPGPDGPPSLGVAIDAYHVWWDPRIRHGIARAGAAGRIFTYHVCDWRVPTRDLLLDRGMMGEGVIDLKALRASVEAAGYEGLVEVEIFSRDWWARPVDEILATCAERLQSVC